MSVPSVASRFDVQTDDPEFAHEVLRQVYTDFSIRISGSTDDFRFSHTGRAAPNFVVTRWSYSMAATVEAEAPPSSVIVSTLVDGHVTVESGRETAVSDPDQPLLMPPHAGWDADMVGASMRSVVLDRSAVDRAARSAWGSDGSRVRFTSMSPVSRATAQYWQRTVEHIDRDVLADEQVASSPLVLASATRSLASALLAVFPNTGAADLGPDEQEQWAQPAVLRRALAYIDEHAAEDVDVQDIAAAARIGVRGLQHLFRRHRDCTPLEQLRRVRMERAHGELQAADPTRGDTVAAVAARWGFAHAGRFSVEYRRAYGRSPSETLRR